MKKSCTIHDDRDRPDQYGPFRTVPTTPTTSGKKNGLRARWWYAGWSRALKNLPDHYRVAPGRNDMKVVFRLAKSVIRKDVNVAMGWWPETEKPA